MNLEKYKDDFILDGFISPVSITSENEARTHRDLLENAERKLGNMHYQSKICLLYTSPSPRDLSTSRMPSSA